MAEQRASRSDANLQSARSKTVPEYSAFRKGGARGNYRSRQREVEINLRPNLARRFLLEVLVVIGRFAVCCRHQRRRLVYRLVALQNRIFALRHPALDMFAVRKLLLQ